MAGGCNESPAAGPRAARDKDGPGVPRTVRKIVEETWETEASLSVFLGLMVLIVFVLPAVGFDRSNEKLYTDVSFTVGMACGVSLAWRSRALFFTAAVFTFVAILFKWATWFVPPHALGVWPLSIAASMSRWVCRSSAPRRITARPSTCPARASPIRRASSKRSGSQAVCRHE